MKSLVTRILIIFLLLFSVSMSSIAVGGYKNELTKIKFSKISENDVKILLYTAKPYLEPLRLLKKNDTEFVLIMPETYSSAPENPSVTEVISNIPDVSVKLYSFISNEVQNGYTKIIIKTNGETKLYTEALTSGNGTLIATNTKPQTISQKSPVTNTVVANNNSVEKVTVKQQIKDTQINVHQTVEKTAETKNVEQNVVTAKQDNINQSIEKEKLADAVVDKNIITKDVANTVEENKTDVISINKISLSGLKIRTQISKVTENKLLSGSILLLILLVGIRIFSVRNRKNKDIIFDIETSNAQNSFEKSTENENTENNFVVEEQKTFADTISQVENDYQYKHEDILNVDQNLSWQEKFRAIQKNKKALFEGSDINSMEINENMTIENPIKKLTQEFKAVKKVLERQKEKLQDETTIEQHLDSNKINETEIITFDEYQKMAEQPKIQIHNNTMPIKSVAPKILTQLKLAPQKGLYLVDYKEKISLVGYVNDKVFKFNSYSSIETPKIYARLVEKIEDRETYIVKFDNKKMLVDVNDEQMNLKLLY